MAMFTHNKDGPLSDGGEETGTEKDEDTLNTSAPPVFIELLLRMIEQLSDDIVSWSNAGDSFIIKQASERDRPGYARLAKRGRRSLTRVYGGLLIPRGSKNTFWEVE